MLTANATAGNITNKRVFFKGLKMEEQMSDGTKFLKLKYYTVLLIIIIVSLTIRIWLLDKRWINPDEGAHMMDAVLILDGAIPSVDYASRQPVYAYSIAAAFKLLGVGYTSGRTLMMLLSLLVALPIFFTARVLYNHTVAFLAAAIYLMLPLEILNSVLVKTEPLSIMVISLSFLMMAQFSEKQNILWLLPAGMLAGLGFYIRQSALILPMAAMVFLVVYGSGDMATKTKRLFYFIGGYILVVFVVVIFYSRYLAFTDIWNSNLNPLFFVLESFKKVLQLGGVTSAPANVAAPPIHVAGQETYALYYKYIYKAFKMHLFLIMGAIFSMLQGCYHVINQKTRKLNEYPFLLLFLWLILLVLAYAYYFHARGFFIDYFREFFPPLVILFAAWLTSTFPDLKKGNNAIHFLLVAGVLWIVLYFTILSFKGLISAKGVILFLLLMLAVFQFFRWKRGGLKKKDTVGVLTAVVILATLGYNLTYTAKRMNVRYDSNWSTVSVEKVSNYIAKNTVLTDTVVSGAVIWELESRRRPFMNISHPLAFIFTIPEGRRLALESAFDHNPPKLIILDGYTEKTYLKQVPRLVELIQSGYYLVLTVENATSPVSVYRRK